MRSQLVTATASVVFASLGIHPASSFGVFPLRAQRTFSSNCFRATPDGNEPSRVDEYRNAVTGVLSKFMQEPGKNRQAIEADPFKGIDFAASMFGRVHLET
mmetsp:Transcript_39690/g.81005  ORF Transcript_39690/g.81005 Transcript_39690/m.81005 type:complete len:101 (-) Transcript_39690:626-928(-)